MSSYYYQFTGQEASQPEPIEYLLADVSKLPELIILCICSRHDPVSFADLHQDLWEYSGLQIADALIQMQKDHQIECTEWVGICYWSLVLQ